MIDPIATKGIQTAAPRRATAPAAQSETAAPGPQDGFTQGAQSPAPVAAVNQQQPAPEFPRPMTEDEKNDFKSWFPALDVDAAVVSADATPQYNCISWTTGNTESWDWPPYMHPELSGRDAFVKYYHDRGFEPFPGKAEDLKELKADAVAYWEDSSDEPTHGSVAGPTHGPRWESKCGQAARIQHGREELVSDVYGHIANFFVKTESKPRPTQKLSPETFQRLQTKLSTRMADVNPQVKANFNKLYAEWKDYRRQPDVAVSSDPSKYTAGEAYEKLKGLGNQALPLFVEKMTQGDFFCRSAVEELSKKKDGFHIHGMANELKPKNVNCSEQEKGNQVLAQWLEGNW